MEFFLNGLSPMVQALIAGLFTWLVTALGAGLVFFFKNINRKVLDLMLGFAAGVMLAASFWSLLAPAIELADASGAVKWLPPLIGFLLGGAFLKLADTLLPHLHMGTPGAKPEGISSTWKRSVLLVAAITLHNIPEGLAVGVAFGAVGAGLPSASLAGAIALAIGIALQNFPEGAAVAIPLRREGLSCARSFLYGQASGIVEPVSGAGGRACHGHSAHTALRALLCRRRNGLRSGGGTHTGSAEFRQLRSRDHRHHAWFRRHDDNGCGARVNEKCIFRYRFNQILFCFQKLSQVLFARSSMRFFSPTWTKSQSRKPCNMIMRFTSSSSVFFLFKSGLRRRTAL